MLKIITILFVCAATLGVSACGGTPELKSPCVGAENSPCDRKAPANQA